MALVFCAIVFVLYFNILVCFKSFKGSVLTNNSSVIQHAWHFWYAVVFVLKYHAEAWALRASHLNWALVLGWHQRLKVSVFIGFFS
ncbi:hypothetical protein BJL76_22875 [Vibrio parahaemolyticus]|nr:hypothetical protein BJL76_22875 [Vibrio parahaemolyticus]OOX49613.1 hypothetical protein BJL79_23750 [Vibrio parahaemolyticus]